MTEQERDRLLHDAEHAESGAVGAAMARDFDAVRRFIEKAVALRVQAATAPSEPTSAPTRITDETMARAIGGGLHPAANHEQFIRAILEAALQSPAAPPLATGYVVLDKDGRPRADVNRIFAEHRPAAERAEWKDFNRPDDAPHRLQHVEVFPSIIFEARRV